MKQKYYNPLFYRRLRFIEGIKAVIHTTSAKIAMAIYISLVLCITLLSQHYINLINIPLLTRVLHILSIVIIPSITICGIIALIIFMGTPRKCHIINDKLRKAEVVNGDKEPPLFIKKYPNKNDNIIFYEFYINCVDIDKFLLKQNSVQSILKRDILSPPEQIRNNEYVRLITAPAEEIPKKIEWRSEYLDNSEDKFNIVLGKGKCGLVKCDFCVMAHWLIASSTGGGKSVLLKHILNQALAKNADVILVDFKGGIDFERYWHRTCEIIIEENSLIKKLEELIDELNRRIKLFAEKDVKDLHQYNQVAEAPLKRIIFACDEAAELLDKEGQTKERKELLEKIGGYLNTLSRISRALGIHIILSSQRLDSKILSGQMRSNLLYRICGRADETLKDVTLGKGVAKEIVIPNYEQGLFVDNNCTIFRGFLPLEFEE